MTHDSFLPDDLIDLERDLVGSRAPVDPKLAAQSLAAVRRELLFERRQQQRQWVLAAVAMLLVGMHLSWRGAEAPWSYPRNEIDQARIADYADRLKSLAPELPSAEAQRQARLALLSQGRDLSLAGSFALPRPLGWKLSVE